MGPLVEETWGVTYNHSRKCGKKYHFNFKIQSQCLRIESKKIVRKFVSLHGKKYCNFYCINVNLFSRKYIPRIGANVTNWRPWLFVKIKAKVQMYCFLTTRPWDLSCKFCANWPQGDRSQTDSPACIYALKASRTKRLRCYRTCIQRSVWLFKGIKDEICWWLRGNHIYVFEKSINSANSLTIYTLKKFHSCASSSTYFRQ